MMDYGYVIVVDDLKIDFDVESVVDDVYGDLTVADVVVVAAVAVLVVVDGVAVVAVGVVNATVAVDVDVAVAAAVAVSIDEAGEDVVDQSFEHFAERYHLIALEKEEVGVAFEAVMKLLVVFFVVAADDDGEWNDLDSCYSIHQLHYYLIGYCC